MVRAFKRLTVTAAFLLLITGCQAMTGETAGQNIDDSALTTSVKTSLAGEKLNTLTRVGVETNNGIVYLTGEVENRHGEVARWNGCFAGKGRQTGRQQLASDKALETGFIGVRVSCGTWLSRVALRKVGTLYGCGN